MVVTSEVVREEKRSYLCYYAQAGLAPPLRRHRETSCNID